MHIKDVCTKQCAMGTFGVLIAVTGIVFAMFWTDIFFYMMAKQMALTQTSKTYEPWKETPIAVNMDIYFFNWTNPDNLLNPSEKPILQQLGPYRFTEKSDKTDIVWHPENYTVSFRKRSLFHFNEKESAGKLTDKITTINMVALSAAAKALHWNSVRKQSVSVGLMLYGQQISVTKTADELLFTGYQDNMVDTALHMQIFGDDVKVPFDRVGWFYTRNYSSELLGHYNMFTGEDNILNIGRMNTWNYEKQTAFFDSYCGMINGSAGEFYPPKRVPGDSISLFTPDMCQSITFDFVEKTTVHGIEGFKYSGGRKSVDNGTLFPEKACFCPGECQPSGVLNISSCRYGSPVFMSYPHYYNADPYYINQVEGLNTSKENHEFYFILEPTTGVVLEVAARLQANMLIRPVPSVSLYEKVPYVYLPVLWFEQKVTIDKDMASKLKTVNIIPTIGQVFAGVIIAIGFIMICWYPVDRCFNRTKPIQNPLSSPPSSVTRASEYDPEKPEDSPLLRKSNKVPKVIFLDRSKNETIPLNDKNKTNGDSSSLPI